MTLTNSVRIQEGITGVITRAWVGTILLLGTWVSIVVTVLASCSPLEKMWQIFPDPGRTCYAGVSPILIGVTLAGNILTDFYLISIPVPALLRAKLGRVQKVSLVGLFSCSSLITAMAIVRVVVIVAVSTYLPRPRGGARAHLFLDPFFFFFFADMPDQQNANSNGDGAWALRECFVGMVTTNLAPIIPLIRKWLSPWLGRLESSTSDGTTNQLGTGAGSSSARTMKSRNRDPKSPGPLKLMTQAGRHHQHHGSESSEHIVDPEAANNDVELQSYKNSPNESHSTPLPESGLEGLESGTKQSRMSTTLGNGSMASPTLIIERDGEVLNRGAAGVRDEPPRDGRLIDA
jgi:hypothetical protein